MIDATEGELHNQDLKIANLAWEAGRGLIIVVNKWDLAEKDDKATRQVREDGAREGAVPQVRAVPVHVGAHGPARDARCSTSSSSRSTRSARKRITTSQVNERARRAARATPAAAGGGPRSQAELRDAGRACSRRRSRCSATIPISWRSTTCASCTTASASRGASRAIRCASCCAARAA